MMARSQKATALLLLVTGLLFAGCRRSAPSAVDPFPLADIEAVSPQAWALLAQQRIFFGHQSVGDDIMAGVEEAIGRHELIALEVRETAEPQALSRGVFAHGKLGRNASYESKLEAFADLLDAGLGENVDVAFLKFCFVDITPETDVVQMFRDYRHTLSRLGERYPETTFVHVSEPLTVRLPGAEAVLRKMKDLIKEAVGRPGYGRLFDNAPRNRFNALLRSGYGNREPLFDLAAVQSSRPGGARVYYEQEGDVHFAMAPEYTDDGGHLNATGRRLVAEQLLVFLANLAVEEQVRDPRDGRGRSGARR